MDDDESVPGLYDPISVPQAQRIARYEAHLREWVDFELAVHIAAVNAITLKDIEDGLAELGNHLEPLRSMKESIEEAFDAGREGLEIGRRSTEKLMVVLKEKNDTRSRLSRSGAKGGAARSNRIEPLRKLAIEKAPSLRGTAAEKARKLMLVVPDNLKNTSNDPERVIREAIRAFEKST